MNIVDPLKQVTVHHDDRQWGFAPDRLFPQCLRRVKKSNTIEKPRQRIVPRSKFKVNFKPPDSLGSIKPGLDLCPKIG
jgi:hypothetical protein